MVSNEKKVCLCNIKFKYNNFLFQLTSFWLLGLYSRHFFRMLLLISLHPHSGMELQFSNNINNIPTFHTEIPHITAVKEIDFNFLTMMAEFTVNIQDGLASG